MNFLLFYFSGFTLAVGEINFVVGTINKQDWPYLYSSFLNQFTSLLLFVQIANALKHAFGKLVDRMVLREYPTHHQQTSN